MAVPLIPIVSALAAPVINALTSAAAPKPSGSLGKEDFLKLLIAQIQNQDPLSPLGNDQFISQSAAFSSLEELQNIRKGVEALGGGSVAAVGGAAALLGQPIVATAGRFAYDGAPVSLPYTLTGAVADAVLEVTDSSGTVVARQPLGAQGAGQHTAVFAAPAGRVLASGQYRYRIVSTDGARTTPLPAIAGSVTGITVTGGQPALQVGPISVDLADVTTIGTPTR